ncbi:hypothetical protein SAMN05216411_10213 [Nitrosospira multiformis]|nr:hypothetical protein SAMN05216411_10213 [Nitrosospira multiformis]
MELVRLATRPGSHEASLGDMNLLILTLPGFTVNAQFRDFSFVIGDHLCGTKHRIGLAGYFFIHSRLLVQRRPSLVQASQSWAQ